MCKKKIILIFIYLQHKFFSHPAIKKFIVLGTPHSSNNITIQGGGATAHVRSRPFKLEAWLVTSTEMSLEET